MKAAKCYMPGATRPEYLMDSGCRVPAVPPGKVQRPLSTFGRSTWSKTLRTATHT